MTQCKFRKNALFADLHFWNTNNFLLVNNFGKIFQETVSSCKFEFLAKDQKRLSPAKNEVWYQSIEADLRFLRMQLVF